MDRTLALVAASLCVSLAAGAFLYAAATPIAPGLRLIAVGGASRAPAEAEASELKKATGACKEARVKAEATAALAERLLRLTKETPWADIVTLLDSTKKAVGNGNLYALVGSDKQALDGALTKLSASIEAQKNQGQPSPPAATAGAPPANGTAESAPATDAQEGSGTQPDAAAEALKQAETEEKAATEALKRLAAVEVKDIAQAVETAGHVVAAELDRLAADIRALGLDTGATNYPFCDHLAGLEEAHGAGDPILKAFDSFKQLSVRRKSLTEAWQEIKKATLPKENPPAIETDATVADALGKLNEVLNKSLNNLPAWCQTIGDAMLRCAQDFAAKTASKPKDDEVDSALAAKIVQARKLIYIAEYIKAHQAEWWPTLKELGLVDNTLTEALDRIGEYTQRLALLRSALALVEELVCGFDEETTQEAIRLFYFANVPQAMKAMNLSAVEYRDEYFGIKSNFQEAREALVTKERDVALKTAETNELITQVARLTSQMDGFAKQVKDKESLVASVGKKLTAAQAAVDKTKEDKGDTSDEYKIAVDKRDALQAEHNQKTTDLTNLQTQQAEATSEKSKRAKEFETTDAARRTAVQERNAMNLQVAVLAAAEVDAFAFEREHATFWYSMPVRTSIDPVRRCMVFGFSESNIVFVRGQASDIAAVKELLASFDRPAPQARITLYTLQINSDNPTKIANNIARVTDNLNEMQGDLTLFQDVFRNAIAREVGRSSRLAMHVFGHKGGIPQAKLPERVWRSFYYPREIRRSLGMDIEVRPGPACKGDLPASCEEAPSILLKLSSAHLDLGMAKTDFQEAVASHLAALDYKHALEASKKDFSLMRCLERAQARREIMLTRAGYRLMCCAEAVSQVRTQLIDLGGSFAEPGPETYSAIRAMSAGTRLAKLARLVTYLVRKQSKDDDWYSYALRVAETSDTLPAGDRISSGLRDAANTIPKDVAGYEQPYALQKLSCIFNDYEVVDTELTNQEEKLASMCTLGYDDEYLRSVDWVTKYTLPDPVHGTTLGEMLFVLSLASAESRERILHDLSQELYDCVRLADSGVIQDYKTEPADGQSRFRQAINVLYGKSQVVTKPLRSLALALESIYGNSERSELHSDIVSGLYPFFPRTILGELDPSIPVDRVQESLTPNQKEMLAAIESRVVESVAAQILEVCDQAPEANAVDNSLFYDQVAPLVGWLRSRQFTSGRKDGRHCDQAPDSYECTGRRFLGTPSEDGTSETAEWVDRAVLLARSVGQQNSLSRATPRVAAADDMIKRFMTVLDGDLYKFIVGPGLDTMRSLATENDVQLGGMQVESILATNRFVARVDVNSSASLGDPGARPLLDVSEQLAALEDLFKKKEAADEGAKDASALALGAAFAEGSPPDGNGFRFDNLGRYTALGFFVAALVDKPEPLTEIYSINGGSQFKVTPIFDPSGQAMRFKFDHVETVKVQDPAGTRDPLAPRVDRHTINTEVQLSNNQFQVISSYDLNLKIGSPERKTGGIPPLNNIAPFREIPIIGYFARRKAAAVRQHSLIFASTTMYPTVGDIVNLLVEVPPTRARSFGGARAPARTHPLPKPEPKP